MPNRIRREMTVPADTTYLAKVRSMVLEVLKQTSLPPVKANMVALAVDEAVANIIQHGYAGRDDGKIEVQIDADDKRFTIRVIDSGISYDTARGADANKDLDMKAHVNAGSKRGLGLFIMRKVMDEVRYDSKEGQQNVLTLVKNIKTA